MKKTIVMAMALCLLVAAPTKSKAENFISVGADLALTLPMSDWGDQAGLGIGGMGRVALSFMTDLGVVGRIGYIHHLEKNGITSSILPILVGLKYDIAFGLGAELLMGMNRWSIEGGGGEITEWEFGMMLGAYFELMGIQVGANLFVPELAEIDNAFGLMFTAGFHLGI
jgi:hypothetical protein